jgi:lipid II:glycine glycyltransferase (peptidoglycan interpeptide bridge formation enzyme)
MSQGLYSALRIVTLASGADRERWNAFVLGSESGHLLQSWEWGAFKQSMGWQVRRIGLEQEGRIVAGAQILIRRISRPSLAIAYIPKGPVVDLADADHTRRLFSAIHQAARHEGCVFLKIEPNLLDNENTHAQLAHHGFRPAPQTNQPRCTLAVDLGDGPEAIWTRMRKKTRQMVRRPYTRAVPACWGLAFRVQYH